MKNSTTVVMLVIFGVVLGVYGLAQWKQLPTRDERRKDLRRIFPQASRLEDDEIDRVTLAQGDESYTFERRGKRWQMTEPIDVMAEPGAVNGLLRDVKSLDMKPGGLVALGDGGGLDQYGLEKPKTTVTLFRGTETVATLLAGDKLPLDASATYVKSADENEFVFVVENSRISSLEKGRGDLREKDLITTGRFDADYVHVAWADRPLTAEKRDGKWHLSTPIEDRADESKVQDLITDAGNVRVENDADFVDDRADDLAQYGLDAPEITVEVRKPADQPAGDAEKEAGEPVVEKVFIGKAVEGDETKRYAMVDGQKYVVAVSAAAVAKLDKQPIDLRNRTLVDVDRFRVDFVRIERPAANVVLAKKDFNWRLYQPVSAAGDSTAISDFLDKLTKLEVQEFLDDAAPADYGLDSPELTVSLWEEGVAEDDDEGPADEKDENVDVKKDVEPTPTGEASQITFGKHDSEAGRVYARRGESKGVVAVSDEVLQTLEQGALAFRDKKIFSFTAFDVARLDVVRDGTSFTLEKQEKKTEGESEKSADPFLSGSDDWRLTSPVDAPANASAVRDLASSLQNLRTSRYVAEKPDDLASYGLAAPGLRVTITMKAEGDKQAEQGVLLVGNPVEGAADANESYASVPDGGLVFTVEKRIVDLLRGELRDPKVFTFAAADAKGLTLAFPDRTWTLRKAKPEGADAEQWAFDGEAPFPLDATKVDGLVNALTTLAADRFVQYQGGPVEGQGLDSPAVSIQIALGDDKKKSLNIGSAVEGDGRFAATPDLEGAVFVVTDAALGQLAADPNYLRVAESRPDESTPATPDDPTPAKTPNEATPPDDKPADPPTTNPTPEP